MTWLFRLWLALHNTDEQAEQLRQTAPQTLSTESASQNLQAAWSASLVTGSDPYMLLYIAWHESRYIQSTRTREPGHKVSCGVMTPVPMRHCRAGSLLDQYLVGAQHLAGWYNYCQVHKQNPYRYALPKVDNSFHDKCALTGYAGGTRLIKDCTKGGHMWRKRGDKKIDLCATWQLYLDGANDLRGAIEKDIRP